MCCDRTAAASAPHDSATRFRGGSRKSPFPSSQDGSIFWDLANPSPRINTCAAITILTAAWKPWLYCTVFRIPYFSGRKSIIHTHASLTHIHLTPLFGRLASFFVAFIFVALVDSEGQWQRYPTSVVMFVFIALLIWCIWTTWEGRADFVARFCSFVKDPRTSGQGEHAPLQPGKDQHDDQGTSVSISPRQPEHQV